MGMWTTAPSFPTSFHWLFGHSFAARARTRVCSLSHFLPASATVVLLQAYAEGLAGEVQFYSSSVDELYAEHNLLKDAAADSLALGAIIAQKAGHRMATVWAAADEVAVSPPTSPSAARAHWERLDSQYSAVPLIL